MSLNLWSSEFNDAVAEYQKGNYIKALNTFYVLAKNGDAEAQYNVGLIYANGKGVKTDIAEAQEWYEQAAKQGNASAAYNLALLYQSAEKINPQAVEQAVYWYEKAAEGVSLKLITILLHSTRKGKG
jgi:TPR repeat protein